MSEKNKMEKIIYEVNLRIEKSVFIENEAWLQQHFRDMVVENGFSMLKLFYHHNTDPKNDDHMRYQEITAQYYMNDLEELTSYFEKLAKAMRSQVIEKLGYHYQVTRRVMRLQETFFNE